LLSEEDISVTKKICLLTILLLAAFGIGCSTANQAANTSQTPTASPAPDNSEVTTSVSADGTRTETRTFRNNPRVSKVVVTTRDGKKTVRVTSAKGEEREVTTDENVLEATGDKIADAAGFVADKSEDVAGEAKDKTEGVVDKTVDTSKKVADKTVDTSKDVGEKVVDTSKNVGEKTVEGAKTVGDKSVQGAKKVGSATVSGAKKAGSAVKKVIP
jgi:hypothetical protein